MSPKSKQSSEGKAANVTVSAEQAVEMYRLMYTARQFEDQLGEIFAAGKLAGWFHSCVGHEATGAAYAHVLGESDHLIPYHRSRVSLFAKGMTPLDVAAEMMGRAAAQSRGRGGDGHMVHPGLNIYGMSGSLGASPAIATGAAYSCQLRDQGEVVLNSFGEGTANRGAVHEAINFAAIWDLPIVYVCENNLYAEFSPIEEQMGAEHVADRAPGYGVPGEIIDGNDPDVVLPAVAAAIDRARSGGGPTLIEAKTYRLRGHYDGDPQEYRSKEEIAEWSDRDPVVSYRARLVDDGRSDADTLDAMESEITKEIGDVMERSLALPLPTREDVTGDVYGDPEVTP